MTAKTIAQTIETFLAQFKDISDSEKLSIFSAVVDCLRYISSISGDARAAARPLQVANFIAAARDFPWHSLDFFATSELTTEDGAARTSAREHGVPANAVDGVILRALPEFFELIADGILESNPDIDQRTLLGATVAQIVDTMPQPVLPPKPAPEIFTHKHASRVYAPRPLTPELFNSLGMLYGCYTRSNGQQVRAFCFNTSAEDRFFILESGEVFFHSLDNFDLPDSVLDFEPYNRQEDFAKLPLSLCVYAQLALADESFYRHVLSPEFVAAHTTTAGVTWFTGRLGAFKHPVRTITVLQSDVVKLAEFGIDDTQKHATIPQTAHLCFPVSHSGLTGLTFANDLIATIVAHVSATGPVFTSLLERKKDNNVTPVMRHDYPRRQLFGFYAFPLPDGLLNLTVQM